MEVIVIGSSSAGNSYLFKAYDETLIVEAGVPLNEVKKALRFDLKSVVGCIVTHEHRDHSQCLVGLLNYGIKVLALHDVFSTFRISNKAFCKTITPNKGYRLGRFKILPLEVSHDVPCVSYVIEHPECGRVLFATDTTELPYKIKGLNNIFIECNYAHDILNSNIEEGVVPSGMRRRLSKSHMELQTTKNFLRGNNLSEVLNIVLIHLSGINGDAERFIREVQELTGIPTIAAHAGLRIDLSKSPF